MNALTTQNGTAPEVSLSNIQSVILNSDLSKITEVERLNYYASVCESLGLNPLTKPFEFITLNSKLVMYASRNCTEQLRNTRRVALKIVSRETIGTVYVVTAQAMLLDGRTDESTGAVNTENLKGEALANAMMKAETKAKRRVTLSICGLSMMDASEDGDWRDATNEQRGFAKNEPIKDFAQFADEDALVDLERIVGVGVDGTLLTDKEVEYYDARIDLTRRGVAREQKGNHTPVFAYTPAQIAKDKAVLLKDLETRRAEIPVADEVDQTGEVTQIVEVDQASEAGEEYRETMEAMKASPAFAQLAAGLQTRFNEILLQLQQGEVVDASTVEMAIEFTATKIREIEELKPAQKGESTPTQTASGGAKSLDW